MKKRLIIIGTFVIIALVSAYLVVSFYAVKFIQAEVQKALGAGFTISQIHVNARYLTGKDISYYDSALRHKTLEVRELRIRPALSALFKGTIVIRELTLFDPYIFLYRSPNGGLRGPWAPLTTRKKQGEAKGMPISIDRIQIKNGSIDFKDDRVGAPPAHILIRNLESRFDNIQIPIISRHSPIQIRAAVKGREKDGAFNLKGWTDLKTRDMKTSLRLTDVEIRMFEPYYREKISAAVQTGFAAVDANVTVANGIIDAPGELELTDLTFNQGGMVFLIPSNTFITRLQEKNNRIKIDFHVSGNLNDPKFGLQDAFLAEIALRLAQELGIQLDWRSLMQGADSTGVEESIEKFLEKKR